MDTMTKGTFNVFYDQKNDLNYVAKVKDEMTKNHKETDQPIQTNFMLENRDD